MEKHSITFLNAAKLLEAGWKYGGKLDAKHGFLFGLRYGQLDLPAFETAIFALAGLPAADAPIEGVELSDYRRFVAAAWTVPLYLSAKRDTGVFDMADARHSAAWHGLIRAITRVLGPQNFG
jgi:hypothetical protein